MSGTWAEIWEFVKFAATNKWVILTATHLAIFYFGMYIEHAHNDEADDSLKRDMEAIRQIANKY